MYSLYQRNAITPEGWLERQLRVQAAGLSAFVGKLGMDRNSPDFYREPSPAAGLAETRRWLDTCAEELYQMMRKLAE